MKPFVPPILLLCFACARLAQAQSIQQEVSLHPGWNAFHLRVTPQVDADTLFSPLPVDSVGLYTGSAYAETRQEYRETSSGEVAPMQPFAQWYRNQPAATKLLQPIGDAVYVCFATNAATFTVTGEPVAPRNQWHVTSGEETPGTLNFVGLRLRSNARLHPSIYFRGAALGDASFYRLSGNDPTKPSLVRITDTRTVGQGDVVLLDCEKAPDWHAPILVSPRHGLDFGLDEHQQILQIRNDSAAAMRLSVSLRSDETGTPPCAVLWQAYAPILGPNSEWEPLDQTTRSLSPGETWILPLGLDRSQFANRAPGSRCGNILRIEDVTNGGSQAMIEVPLSATVQSPAANDWPAGLWAVDVRLTEVSRVLATDSIQNGLPVARPLTVRLYLHVDADGAMRLLQRVVVAYSENAAGESDIMLCPGDSAPPDSATFVQRLSSIVLPVDQPIVAGEGTFGATATFAFSVGAESPSNPFLHRHHPDHDGLDAAFANKLPTGEDFQRYVSAVKPETFALPQSIRFEWDESKGAAAWNPEDKRTGRAHWTFSGLRHEGDLLASGAFSMRRIIPVSTLEP